MPRGRRADRLGLGAHPGLRAVGSPVHEGARTSVGRAEHGYLIVADIAGYTRFVAGTELEHSQAILADVLEGLLGHVRDPLRLVKLEGDAVFCYAPAEAFSDATRIVELSEAAYFDFAARLRDMQLATTCQCAACATMSSLDLKFCAHYGEYVVQTLAGREDLAGPDVVLVHRLLKNAVTARTGIPAYLLLTAPIVARLALPIPLVPHEETYEHLGEVEAGVHDLGAAFRAMEAARHVAVAAEEADLVHVDELPAPPSVVWDWHVDPLRRLAWQEDLAAVTFDGNEEGRFGAGATMHCAHGSFTVHYRILDWRPFDYYTFHAAFEPVLPTIRATFAFSPLPGGRTRVEYRFRAEEAGALPEGFADRIERNVRRLEAELEAARTA